VPGTKDIATDDIGFLLAKASAHFNELLVERFAAAGFPDVRPSYGSVLVPLFEHDAMRLGELAGAARLSKQAITGLVAQCERAGLVERQRDPTDGRAFVVRLGSRGRSFRAVAERVLADLEGQLVQQLGPRNRQALARALRGVMQL